MDKRKLSEKLNEVFGDKTVRLIMPEKFLVNLQNILVKQNEELVKQIQEKVASPNLVEENKKTRELLGELKQALLDNKISKVEVSNLPPPPVFPELHIPEPKEVKIPPFPKEINFVKPKWYEEIQEKLVNFLVDGFLSVKKTFESALNSHMAKEKAIAVRLVDTEGKVFYNAAFYGGGGGASLPALDRTTDNIGIAHQTDALLSDTTVLTPKFAKIDTATSADLIALVSSKKLRIISGFLTVAADTTIKFQSGGSTDLTGAMTVKAGGGFVWNFNPTGHFETASGAKLNMVLGTAVQVSGGLTYVEV